MAPSVREKKESALSRSGADAMAIRDEDITRLLFQFVHQCGACLSDGPRLSKAIALQAMVSGASPRAHASVSRKMPMAKRPAMRGVCARAGARGRAGAVYP